MGCRYPKQWLNPLCHASHLPAHKLRILHFLRTSLHNWCTAFKDTNHQSSGYSIFQIPNWRTHRSICSRNLLLPCIPFLYKFPTLPWSVFLSIQTQWALEAHLKVYHFYHHHRSHQVHLSFLLFQSPSEAYIHTLHWCWWDIIFCLSPVTCLPSTALARTYIHSQINSKITTTSWHDLLYTEVNDK